QLPRFKELVAQRTFEKTALQGGFFVQRRLRCPVGQRQETKKAALAALLTEVFRFLTPPWLRFPWD
ncbi:hypothetical protein NML03_27530, partial [Klebsiella pneumoniae]|uniref:hypothetical protein n=1 Tax=Klebsiella pneumoniae TaxID=573 RepID=UPI0020C92FEA